MKIHYAISLSGSILSTLTGCVSLGSFTLYATWFFQLEMPLNLGPSAFKADALSHNSSGYHHKMAALGTGTFTKSNEGCIWIGPHEDGSWALLKQVLCQEGGENLGCALCFGEETWLDFSFLSPFLTISLFLNFLTSPTTTAPVC